MEYVKECAAINGYEIGDVIMMLNNQSRSNKKIQNMIVVGIITCVIVVITGFPTSVYAHSDSSNSGYQYANSAEDQQQSYQYKYNNGWIAGQYQAQSDYSAGNQYPDQGCKGHHTYAYCQGYFAGYGDMWNRSIDANSPGTQSPPLVQYQSPGASAQQGTQGNSINCVNVVNCNPSTHQQFDQNGRVVNGGP